MSARASDVRSNVLRFDLAIQRNHTFVYTLGFLTGLAGKALGVFPLKLDAAIAIWLIGCTGSTLFYFLYRAGVDRRYLNPIWVTYDIFFVTLGIYASGGVRSPWFI